jgi:DNA polymerase III gamma/tau subunit
MSALQDIFGQRDAVDAILRAYRAGRLAHGLIFAGPAGVGKATTARALAQLFLCLYPSGEQACGACQSSILMQAFNPSNQTTTHPYYHVVYRQLIRLEKNESKARDLSVKVIRDHLVAPASLKATMNHGKVFIIEEAELMNAAAQNALLKTLEEPYGGTLIILLTDQPHALLPTIRSRCQIIRFAALEPAVVRDELQKRGIDQAMAQQTSELSEGSLGVALKWIEDGVVAKAQELNRQIEALVGGHPVSDLGEWFKSAADAYAAKQIERDKQSSKDQATREGLVLYLRLAANRFRQELHAGSDAHELERSCVAIDGIVRSEGYLDSNVNVSLALQQLGGGLERAFSKTR